jgi:uncharacterized RDD family membrane protein YckC
VKCPKCGFVSYPGLTQCKRCGHQLAPTAGKEPPTSGWPAGSEPPPAPPRQAAPPPPAKERYPTIPLEPVQGSAQTSRGDEASLHETEQADEASRAWRDEISERVEDHRRRRARLRGGFDPDSSLELDFQSQPHAETESQLDDKVIEFPGQEPNLDMAMEWPAPRKAPALDSFTLERPGPGQGIVGAVPLEAAAPEEEQPAQPPPVEVVLDSAPPMETAETQTRPFVLPVAPIGRRFVAGLLDALVLLVAGGVFALIFWRAGGHLTLQPLNLAVVAFIAMFFLMAYFGAFTALTSTTPGLLWMGIEVRNLKDESPTPAEAFWRAFGCLISSAALMLGFVWALVDSDGLTWHDRMSRTYLALAEAEHGQASLLASHPGGRLPGRT